jgi:hypothetical protein
MSTNNSQGTWDYDRQQWRWWIEPERCWMYEDGHKVYPETTNQGIYSQS